MNIRYPCKRLQILPPSTSLSHSTSRWSIPDIGSSSRRLTRWAVSNKKTIVDNRLDAISTEEFANALHTVWHPVTQYELPNRNAKVPPHHIGLAISGGADSMALALLCRELEDIRPDLYSFHAIVIDHQARKESREEALEVIQMLQDRKISVSLSTLSWDNIPDPIALPNFESVARRLRYRALGDECVANSLRYVLLGHHEDDQAETILSRIVNGYTMSGLRGINQSAGIPENEDRWGISEGPRKHIISDLTGTIVPSKKALKGRAKQIAMTSKSNHPQGLLWFASRGITIHRPLLQFRKQRLIATCRDRGLEWKEDRTNHDPSLTLRNTSRWLLDNNLLPAALRRKSLIHLANKARSRIQRSEDCGAQASKYIKILDFDIQAGVLKIQIGSNFLDSCCFGVDLQKDHRQIVAEQVVSQFTKLIAPQSSLRAGALTLLTSKILSVLSSDCNASKSLSIQGAGVLWKLESPSRSFNIEKSWTWSVQREVPSAKETETTILSWTRGSSAPSQRNHISETKMRACGEWQLFDQRFWINIDRAPHESVSAKFLSTEGLGNFRKDLPNTMRVQLEERLHQHAPGTTRFTLPALWDDTDDRVIALPSMHITLPEAHSQLVYRICYKAIDHLSFKSCF